jgi:hypothetical protein
LSWTRTSLIAISATAGMLSFATARAETIVVRSTGPSAKGFPPGKSIADRSKVSLKAGDQLVILDGRGTRTLKGPGVFDTTAGASSGATGSTFASLLRNTGTRQVRTGAVRGGGASDKPVRSPNLWFVDVGKSGTICLADASAISLWRAPIAEPASLTVTRLSDGKSAVLAWAKGQSVKAWPIADLPVTAGAQYRLSGAGLGQPTTIKFALLGPNPEGLESTVSALIRNNCSAQLDLVIETVALPGDTAEPSS